MANTNTPSGFVPWRNAAGGTWEAQGSIYSIPSTDNNAYYKFDALKTVAGGDAQGYANITKITTGTEDIRGSLVGVIKPFPGPSIQGTPLDLEYTYIPATKATAYYVLVYDDFNGMFMCQDDGITTANLAATKANMNASLTIAAGGSNVSNSGTVLLSSSFADTNSLNVKLEGLCQIPGNVYGAYAKWQCRINVSALRPSGATGA